MVKDWKLCYFKFKPNNDYYDNYSNNTIFFIPLQGATIPFTAIKNDLENQFKLVVEKYYEKLESYYQIHAIYSHFYHDPRKQAVQVRLNNNKIIFFIL